jgi:hypothetical protein
MSGLMADVQNPVSCRDRDCSQLLHQAQHVHYDPLLCDLVTYQAKDVHPLDHDLPSGSRHTHELASMCALHSKVHDDEILLGNEPFRLEVEIWKGHKQPGEEVSLRTRSNHLRQIGIMSDILFCQ